MPKVYYGTKLEPGFELKQSKDLLAVRTRSRRLLSVSRGPVPDLQLAEIQSCELIAQYPESGVEVYRIPSGRNALSLSDHKSILRSSPEVQFVGGVLIDPKTNEPVLYTENLFLKFSDAHDPDACDERIRQMGLLIKQQVTYAANAFFCQAPEGTGQTIFTIAEQLLDLEEVEYCHPELIRPRAIKGISTEQWHLKKTTIAGVDINAHANVEKAHQSSLGDGVVIAIIDDGVDIDHPEFGGSHKIVAPRDATLQNDDPRPKDIHPSNPEDHGTACAGVACANGTHGACGVAPNSKLMPIRLTSGLGSHREAEAFEWAVNHGAHIISCSWGPPDGRWFNPNDRSSDHVYPLPAHTKLAIENAVKNGRGGLGCIVLFAAGNGNESMNTDQYASNPNVIAVAACNDRGTRCVYSDFGDKVWCSFPSNDFAWPAVGHPAPLTKGIWTTDRIGAAGYNEGNVQRGDVAGSYTNSFGGTSSSTPGVAGVAALMLSVNPNLSAASIRDLLSKSCDKIDATNGAYNPSTGHSKYYGFGRINAATAVELAKPQPVSAVTISRNFDQLLPDLQTVEFKLQVAESSPIQSLTVQIDLEHTYIGDLIIRLKPPIASESGVLTLHNRGGGRNRSIRRTYNVSNTPELSRIAGKKCDGDWILSVEDAAVGDSGKLISFGLTLTFPHPSQRILPRGKLTQSKSMDTIPKKTISKKKSAKSGKSAK